MLLLAESSLPRSVYFVCLPICTKRSFIASVRSNSCVNSVLPLPIFTSLLLGGAYEEISTKFIKNISYYYHISLFLVKLLNLVLIIKIFTLKKN